jgi:hypothetical protein
MYDFRSTVADSGMLVLLLALENGVAATKGTAGRPSRQL